MIQKTPHHRALLAKRSRGDIGLAEIVNSIEHWVQHGDWTGLSTLMETLGPRDCRVIVEICERCILGARFEPSQKYPSGWRLKRLSGIERSVTPALNACKNLAANGHSFRSKIVADILSLKWGYEDNWDLDEAMKRMINRAIKSGKSKEIIEELNRCRQRLFNLDPWG